MYLHNLFAPACVPQAVVVGVRIVCYNIRLWDTSEGVRISEIDKFYYQCFKFYLVRINIFQNSFICN
ncbi:MAG: hypothetical protein EAZ85_02815 [Bacteroidetes bacterium]|nr:MAG: hypothetical protein EAZ85_02815 [Bacteroidota bacterium]